MTLAQCLPFYSTANLSLLEFPNPFIPHPSYFLGAGTHLGHTALFGTLAAASMQHLDTWMNTRMT
jgi:hypothetical protein